MTVRHAIKAFSAEHTEGGGWEIAVTTTENRPRAWRASFSTFDEMIRWLRQQYRMDAGAAKPRPAAGEDGFG